jgi:rhamnosyl/mannosyltransferase
MRVLHVYRTYYPDPPGGLQEAIRQICLAVKPHGIHSTIFTLSPAPEPATISYPEADVVRLRSWVAPASCDIGGLKAFTTFRRLASMADMVHYFFPWPFADLLHQTLPSHTPAVMTYISDIVRQKCLGRMYTPLMHRTLSQMRAIAASSPAYARTSPILTQARIHPKVQIIPLGIAEPDQVRNAADIDIFLRLGLNAAQPYVLFLGVLRYYKGLHTIIQAASTIDAPIVIAGSGPEEHHLRSLAAAQRRPNIIFAGQVSDAEKHALLKHCTALVLPSHLRSEAYGMVLIEAAMYARPLVSCEIGTGTSFINQHNRTGFVVPPESPHELGAALNTLVHDPARARSLGRAARRRYEEMFSGSVLGKAYADFFRSALQ